MIAWSIKLSEYGIVYEPRTAIKAQALADFIAELTEDDKARPPLEWSIIIDRSSNESF